jgi:hypothetical protein
VGAGRGQGPADLRCWREGKRTRWEAAVQQGELTVQEQPWEPWRVEEPKVDNPHDHPEHPSMIPPFLRAKNWQLVRAYTVG